MAGSGPVERTFWRQALKRSGLLTGFMRQLFEPALTGCRCGSLEEVVRGLLCSFRREPDINPVWTVEDYFAVLCRHLGSLII
jgi:hypothetical protein